MCSVKHVAMAARRKAVPRLGCRAGPACQPCRVLIIPTQKLHSAESRQDRKTESCSVTNSSWLSELNSSNFFLKVVLMESEISGKSNNKKAAVGIVKPLMCGEVQKLKKTKMVSLVMLVWLQRLCRCDWRRLALQLFALVQRSRVLSGAHRRQGRNVAQRRQQLQGLGGGRSRFEGWGCASWKRKGTTDGNSDKRNLLQQTLLNYFTWEV